MPSSFYDKRGVSIADGGGIIRLDIPQGGILWHVAIFPDAVSVPETNVKADLGKYIDEDTFFMRTEVLALGNAFSDAVYSHAHKVNQRVELPDDERLQIQAVIYNLTGASVKWNICVIVEVEEHE